MFKGLSNLGSLIKHAQQIGGQMQQLNEDMKHRRATGSSGGGMVEIEVNGLLDVLKCRIDQQLIDGGDRELLEDLVIAAANQAMTKARQLHAEAVKELTGGMQLPGLQDALSKITKEGDQTEEP
jgi:DNA-binding YbaB/EbfC family protein